MNDTAYWVNIHREGKRLGAGFLLTACYVLTAHHCLGMAAPEAEKVDIEFASGERLPGRVHRRSPESDLALIDVPRSGQGPIIPRAHRARKGEEWWNPYRPSDSDGHISGTIDAVPVTYRCEGGARIEAIQLECREDFGDYAGYSGSPIEGDRSDARGKLFGILIEQYPDQGGTRPASKVLFAATLSEVFRRFDCFDIEHLIDLLPSSAHLENPGKFGQASQSPSSNFPHRSVSSDIEQADTWLRTLDAWQKEGLIDSKNVTELKLSVIEKYLNGSSERGRP